ncbi:MAG TPA: (Fe-S)-binding protein [Casimicrobiaceae bacterium]
MSPLGISLLMLVAFTGFFWLAWRKLAIVAALQPEVRWDHPGARLKRVFVHGLLQSRMIFGDPKAGLMHCVIFLGFVALLARKVQLIVIGYRDGFVYPGLAGGLFAGAKDLVELAVLAAVGYAFWRRFVIRPSRLERNLEAVLVLSLIAAIMITDLLFDGFRFALLAGADPGIAHEQSYAVVGGALASAFGGWSENVLRAAYHTLYWLQMLTVFGFLVLLPLGEHFHIVTGIPGLFFAKPGPLNRVPSVDLDRVMNAADGEEVKVGVRTARDLIWKDAFDAFTCTECGRCKEACPTFLTGKPLALKWVHDSVKHHLMENRQTIVAGPLPVGTDDPLPPLAGDVISADALWACTTCGYCESACPIELEHLGKFYRMRQHQVMMEGAFPHELKAVFDAYEVQSNPWGLAADTRGAWANGLGVPIVQTVDDIKGLDYLFYVGSAESFDPRGQKVATAFVKVLQEAGVRVGILGAAESSTGECVRRAGNEMLFQQLAATLVATLNGLGVTRIVTCDPHAFNSLKNEYPEFGGHYEVIHHTQLIARLVAEGRLKVRPVFERVIYHEPCYLGRHNGEYEAPRSIIGSVVRDTPLEFPLSRAKAMCCGAGGARMWMEESIGKRINVTRVEQALPQAPTVIATACPYCAVMMDDGIGTLGQDGAIETRDVAELVAEAMEHRPRAVAIAATDARAPD